MLQHQSSLASNAELKFATIASTYIQSLISAEPDTLLLDRTRPVETIHYFTALQKPSVSLANYIARCMRYGSCSTECFVLALAYIRRAAKKGLALNSLTVHRLFITALVVAVKVHEDAARKGLDHYAVVGGVHARDLAVMELKFLMNVLDFRAQVPIDEYFATCRDITRVRMAAAAPQLRKREVTSSDDDGSENGLSLTDYPSRRTVAADCARMQELLDWSKECFVFLPCGGIQDCEL